MRLVIAAAVSLSAAASPVAATDASPPSLVGTLCMQDCALRGEVQATVRPVGDRLEGTLVVDARTELAATFLRAEANRWEVELGHPRATGRATCEVDARSTRCTGTLRDPAGDVAAFQLSLDPLTVASR